MYPDTELINYKEGTEREVLSDKHGNARFTKVSFKALSDQ